MGQWDDGSCKQGGTVHFPSDAGRMEDADTRVAAAYALGADGAQ